MFFVGLLAAPPEDRISRVRRSSFAAGAPLATKKGGAAMYFDDDGRFHLGEAKLVEVFSVAFARTLERDAVLFDVKPQERAFMHRFAQELRRGFSFAEDYRINGKPVISLDVEYNRLGKGLKHDNSENPDKNCWIAPDIILHERMSGGLPGRQKNRNNIFVCEMKRDGCDESKDACRLKN